jgi:hypothetical protein
MLTTLLMESVWLATELYASGAVTSETIPDAAAFCRALDEELLRREAIGLVVNKTGEPPPAVRRVVWRGASAREVMVWIAELDPDGRLGLLVRIGEEYLWTTGDRDTVLASVPDQLFAEAVSALS